MLLTRLLKPKNIASKKVRINIQWDISIFGGHPPEESGAQKKPPGKKHRRSQPF